MGRTWQRTRDRAAEIAAWKQGLIPEARIVRVVRIKCGTWLLTVACPYCRQQHHHGGGRGDQPFAGHRIEHCSDPALKKAGLTREDLGDGYEMVGLEAAPRTIRKQIARAHAYTESILNRRAYNSREEDNDHAHRLEAADT